MTSQHRCQATKYSFIANRQLTGCVALLAGVLGCSGGYDELSEDGPLDTIGLETQCGSTSELQNVERYDGTLGVSRDFVNDYEPPVVFFPVGCSGTMISKDLVLTAGHCQIAAGDTARFNFQNDPFGNPRPVTDFTVDSVVEQKDDGEDYEIVRLKPNFTLGDAGAAFGWMRISRTDPAAGDTLAIIGHPSALPKMIEAGTQFSSPAGWKAWEMTYSDIDTLPGNSGSGVLSWVQNALVGVHTDGGCTSSGGANRGQRMRWLVEKVSPTLANLSQALSRGAAAFVWTQQTTGTFTASDAFSYNSSGAANTVTNLSTGRYRVDLPNLGGEKGGNAQVTAYGGSSNRCKVENWTSSGTTLQVFVSCFTAGGALTNSQFTASYAGRLFVPGSEGGYVWADQPNIASYTPDIFYQWNSAGRGVTIRRTMPGQYVVRFPKQGSFGGTAEVTAYGTGSEYCKVAGWGAVGEDQQVSVNCFNTFGAAADSRFTLAFSSMSPQNTPAYSYAWANNPSATTTYTPDTFYQRGFIAGRGNVPTPITISRFGVGRYSVNFPEMAFGGGSFGKSNVKVTGYGSDSTNCSVGGWSSSANGASATVSCFTASGAPVDALYTITYSTTQSVLN